MQKEYCISIEVKSYYAENGIDIRDILKKSILLFVESEVKKLCLQNS